MKFSNLVTLLSDTKNQPYVLEGLRRGKKIVVAPSLVGRVMGTTVSGSRGQVLGWVNQSAIEQGMNKAPANDWGFNNFGGEERFWFAPEGGQFGLCMGRHLSGLEHYHTPAAFNTQPFKVLDSDRNSVMMKSRMRLANAKGTKFVMDVTRAIRAADACPYTLGCQKQVDFVGFESKNTVRNVDTKPVRRNQGALGMFLIGQFPSRARSIAIVPFKPGTNRQLGVPIREDYFACCHKQGKPLLPSRGKWKTGRDFSLFKTAGKTSGKIGIGRQRTIPRLGCLDLDSNELIIMDFDFYPEHEYVASYWRNLKDPYDGDTANFAWPGPLGDCYEMEALSPALFLQPGQTFSQRNRIFHIFGPDHIISELCQRFFNVSREIIEQFDEQF